ncbi:MAG: YqgE/AlgH family protein [Chlorobium sp.]|jgi:putative transcriptional regulator|nr:YqgE/AlgH family protein [Chlorobium sp.]
MVNEFEKLQSGKLLLASANLLESNFKRTVLIICEHNESGSLGFILNRPMEFKVCEAVAGFEEIEEPLHMGGPVQVDTVHFLHSRGDIIDGATEIFPGLFWGGDKNQVSFLLNTGVMQPSEIRFFLGYSGWSAGQLEEEFEIGSWYIAEASRDVIFSDAYERMWSRSVRSKGGEYQFVANAPELPGLN